MCSQVAASHKLQATRFKAFALPKLAARALKLAAF